MSNDPFEVLLKPDGHKSPHTAAIKLTNSSGRYSLGPPLRPPIKHDHGHLDKYPKREATEADRIQLAKWKAILLAAENACTPRTGKYFDTCNREDLTDATAAYRHFLYGGGASRVIDYERYLNGDPAAADLITKLINDFRVHTEIIGSNRSKYSITSTAYAIGPGGFARGPATANWQKTLGAHNLWVSADVTVSVDDKGQIWYDANLTLHMEDMYNFNPGQHDLATGIPDLANGTFEITGLAKEYVNVGTALRHTRWVEGERVSNSSITGPANKKSGRAKT
jgi:hypothetical protein